MPQLAGEGIVPAWIKCPQILQELGDAHPVGKFAVLAQVADPAKHAHGVEHRVSAEDAHRALLGLQQAEQVLDERRLAGAILADQPEHGTGGISSSSPSRASVRPNRRDNPFTVTTFSA